MYKSVVIEYCPKADNMARKIEDKANEMGNVNLVEYGDIIR